VFAQNKVYDATVVAALDGTAVVAALPGDDVSVRLSAVGGGPLSRFDDKNVGTGKTVTTAIRFSPVGADAGNYTFIQPTFTADITHAPLRVTGLTALDKTYDGTTLATISGSAAVTPLGQDSVFVSGSTAPSGSFADKNVGTAKNVTVSGLTLAGPDAGNYTLDPTSVTASITRATLLFSGVGVLTRAYDGTTAATLTGTPTVSPLGDDVVAVGGSGTGVFLDKNAGTAKPVTYTGGFTLSGADAGNYELQPAGTLTGDITRALLQVSGLTAVDKVYDATTIATLSGTATVSPVPGDEVTIAGTAGSARFADKNVGRDKPVSLSGSYALSGADAGNYTLQEPALSASITAAPLLVVGLSAADKVYDGGTAATLLGSAGVVPLAGDSVSLAAGSTPVGRFDDPNAGPARNVSVSGLTLSGADAGNYTLVSPALTAAILQATLFYVADPATRTAAEPLEGFTGRVEGFVAGETQAGVTTGTLLFTTNATAISPSGSYGVFGQGLLANNYVFEQAAGNATALTFVGAQGAVEVVNDVSNDVVKVTAIPPLAVPPPTTFIVGGLADLSTPVAVADTGGTSSSGTVGAVGIGAASLPSADSSLASTASASFAPVRLSSMSPDALREMLEGRERYKQKMFAEAVLELTVDPALADLKPCRSLQDAETGKCIVTDELRERVQAAAAAAAAQPATASAPQPQAPAPASGGAPAATARAATPAETPLSALERRRRVVQAALPQIQRKVAVVVGIDAYADPAIPRLGNAVRDAEAVGKLFETSLGYETVVLRNATRAELVGTLNRLALELGPRDSVVLYYAGHGAVVEATGLGYWQLSDSDSKKPDTWLSNADIGRLISRMPSSQVALISDSCYSGTLAGGAERIRVRPGSVDPQAVLERRSSVVMTSGGNEPVFDEGKQGHSPFAWNLMNALGQVSSWQAGGQIFERVRFAVAKELPQRPQYAASSATGHESGGDYLFEERKLEPL
jgi:hypothetical protein